MYVFPIAVASNLIAIAYVIHKCHHNVRQLLPSLQAPGCQTGCMHACFQQSIAAPVVWNNFHGLQEAAVQCTDNFCNSQFAYEARDTTPFRPFQHLLRDGQARRNKIILVHQLTWLPTLKFVDKIEKSNYKLRDMARIKREQTLVGTETATASKGPTKTQFKEVFCLQ